MSNNPNSRDLTDQVSDEVESMVDDLNQQDVLPADEGISDLSLNDTVDGELDQAGRWDDPVGDTGTRAKRAPLEDEVKASEVLVDQGLNEAEEDLRDLEEDEETEDEEEL